MLKNIWHWQGSSADHICYSASNKLGKDNQHSKVREDVSSKYYGFLNGLALTHVMARNFRRSLACYCKHPLLPAHGSIEMYGVSFTSVHHKCWINTILDGQLQCVASTAHKYLQFFHSCHEVSTIISGYRIQFVYFTLSSFSSATSAVWATALKKQLTIPCMPHKVILKSSAFPHVARCGVSVTGKSNFLLLLGTLNVSK